MGQAFRRATGRIAASSSSSAKPKTVVDRKPPVAPTEKPKISRTAAFDGGNQPGDGNRPANADNVLETRDPNYDAMLNQMLGRVKAKPGGKPEMGEAYVAGRYSRQLPKLRNTQPDSSRYEERAVPPGTLNVAQLRHLMRLHHGKADDHNGPMNVNQIAEQFSLEVKQVEAILQTLSLPPEDDTKQENDK